MGLFGPKKKRSVRKYKSFLTGRKITEVTYSDTGKKEKHVTKPHWWSGTVTDSYIIRKGKKKCFRCKSTVYCDDDGVYRCSCGNEFR